MALAIVDSPRTLALWVSLEIKEKASISSVEVQILPQAHIRNISENKIVGTTAEAGGGRVESGEWNLGQRERSKEPFTKVAKLKEEKTVGQKKGWTFVPSSPALNAMKSSE